MPDEEILTLEELCDALVPAYLEMVAEFEAAGEGYPYNNIPLARSDPAAFVRELGDERQGIGLPPGSVPQTTYLLVRDGERVVGELRFRPTVPPPYGNNNGHVGYNIRPSERRKGYAAHGLGMLLNKGRELGLEGFMVPVEGENPGSVRTIEKHGGTLFRRDTDPHSGEVTSWYWIGI